MWTGAPKQAAADARNAVFYGEKAIDRSPCGTGTSARMAQKFGRGELAVGDGFVGVRPGLWHSEGAAMRIVLHEIEGHVRPRVLAQREELALFRVGSARSNDDEEGRALLLERGAGVLEGGRRRELPVLALIARDVESDLRDARGLFVLERNLELAMLKEDGPRRLLGARLEQRQPARQQAAHPEHGRLPHEENPSCMRGRPRHSPARHHIFCIDTPTAGT